MKSQNKHSDKLKGLYVITDERLITEQHFPQAITAALQGGARIIQYRDKSEDSSKRFKQANLLRSLCQRYDALCIINDDIELAKEVNAHGVHLGKDDISITKARQLLGENAIIGVSCYNDISLALTAEKKSAEKNQVDYVAFGAIFSSATKPQAVVAGLEIITKAKAQLSMPICCIGGITENNITQVLQHGSDMAAVISSVFAKKDIKQATLDLNQFFSF